MARAARFLAGPLIWEGSSWVSLILFLWIPWLAWRLAPPGVRPRWKLLLHVPAALAFAFAHVGGFDLLRILAYRIVGTRYEFGSFATQLLFEARKDLLGYALFIGLFSLIDHLLQRPSEVPAETSTTFDIRDGARLTRVKLKDIFRRYIGRQPLRGIHSCVMAAGLSDARAASQPGTRVGRARLSAHTPLLAGEWQDGHGAEARWLRRLYGGIGSAVSASAVAALFPMP